MKRGFTLVENVVAVAVFALLAGAIYQTSALLIRSVASYRENTTISSLASQYMEIVHNLPYSDVGVIQGNPSGTLPSEISASETNINGTNYKIYYAVSYVDDPADGLIEDNDADPSPWDYKQVKLYIEKIADGSVHSFLTSITPKGLEGLDGAGALAIQVIDASGQPVPNATINIKEVSGVTEIERTADASGKWIEVGLTPGVNNYHVSVTKSGYSTDLTYPITTENPMPEKPDPTIESGKAAKISFAIDRLSDLSFETLDLSCNKLPNINMQVIGKKIIGKPSLLKFDRTLSSDSAGKIDLTGIEYDDYTPGLISSLYSIYGSSPIQQVSVLPNTNQNYTLLLGPKTDNSLLVIVKDEASGNPLEGATVRLQSSNNGFDESKTTGGSVWSSDNWSDNPNQEKVNVATDIIPYALRLFSNDGGATYADEGTLTSEVFDTGTASTTFSTINWQPTTSNPNTEIKFQVATSNTNNATTTWSFVGQDGSATSYYTNSGTDISSPAARYVRYKAFLSTTDNSLTPVLSSLNINYVSGCFTPGQVFFSGLTAGNDYSLEVSAAGRATQIVEDLNITGYNSKIISL